MDLDIALPIDTALSRNFPALPGLVTAIAHGAKGRDRGESSARDAVNLCRSSGLGKFRLPKTAGGWGATLVQLFELVMLLAEADSNIPHILRNHFAFVERALVTPKSEKYRRWLALVEQQSLIGLAATELGVRNVGNPVHETILKTNGDGFVLSGRKFYSTGNFYSDYLIVQALTQDGSAVSILVPTDRNGVCVDDDWDGMGQTFSASGTTIFENVAVAAEEILYVSRDDVALPYRATFMQLYLTAIVAGILRSIVMDATVVVKTRNRNYYHAAHETPSEDPLLQQTIGRLSSVAYVAEASVLRAADALALAFDSAARGDIRQEFFIEAAARTAKCKVVIDELALSAATQLFDVGGASAISRNKRLDRHWRNIRTLSSHNPISYKARALGQLEISGSPLPQFGFF